MDRILSVLAPLLVLAFMVAIANDVYKHANGVKPHSIVRMGSE